MLRLISCNTKLCILVAIPLLFCFIFFTKQQTESLRLSEERKAHQGLESRLGSDANSIRPNNNAGNTRVRNANQGRWKSQSPKTDFLGDRAPSDRLMVNRLDDPREFIKANWQNGIPYDLLKGCIQKDEVPILYDLLKDSSYRPHWPMVARVIGLVSDDVNSVPVLVNYMRLNDCDSLSDHMFGLKVRTPIYYGIVGGDKAKEILLRAITEDGAKDLMKGWVGSERAHQQWERNIRRVRNAAYLGLAFLNEPDTNALIEQHYQRELALLPTYTNWESCELFDGLVEAMVQIAHIKDVGKEKAVAVANAGGSRDILRPYYDRYIPPTPKTPEQEELEAIWKAFYEKRAKGKIGVGPR